MHVDPRASQGLAAGSGDGLVVAGPVGHLAIRGARRHPHPHPIHPRHLPVQTRSRRRTAAACLCTSHPGRQRARPANQPEPSSPRPVNLWRVTVKSKDWGKVFPPGWVTSIAESGSFGGVQRLETGKASVWPAVYPSLSSCSSRSLDSSAVARPGSCAATVAHVCCSSPA